MRCDCIDDDTMEEVCFVAHMVGIDPEQLIRDAVKHHLDHRASLTEFKPEIDRHMRAENEVATRLKRRAHRMQRQAEAETIAADK